MGRSAYRFYYPGTIGAKPENPIALPPGESHHLLNVLRLQAGQTVSVFDDAGHAWGGEVAGRRGKRALIALGEPLPSPGDKAPRLLVAAALLKRRAMDLMIEKLSELGVATLQPLVTRRTVVAAPHTAGATAPPRWDRIALAAAKQAGRNAPMTFYPATPLASWLARERPRVLGCFAHGGAGSVGLGRWLGDRAGMNLPVLVAVGPEGGWTPGEVAAFKKAGFQAVALGPLVLRAETAAITVAAACRVML